MGSGEFIEGQRLEGGVAVPCGELAGGIGSAEVAGEIEGFSEAAGVLPFLFFQEGFEAGLEFFL